MVTCQAFRQTIETDRATGDSAGDSPVMAMHFEECEACQRWLGRQTVQAIFEWVQLEKKPTTPLSN